MPSQSCHVLISAMAGGLASAVEFKLRKVFQVEMRKGVSKLMGQTGVLSMMPARLQHLLEEKLRLCYAGDQLCHSGHYALLSSPLITCSSCAIYALLLCSAPLPLLLQVSTICLLSLSLYCGICPSTLHSHSHSHTLCIMRVAMMRSEELKTSRSILMLIL